MLRAVAAAILFTQLSGAQVLFQDDFDDGDAQGWHEISMVNYDVVDGMYRMYGGYEENHGITFNGDDNGYMSTADYSTTCMIVPETGSFFGMMMRFSEANQHNIMIVLSDLHQDLRIYSWHLYGITLLDSESFPVEMNQQYWMRFEVLGDVFRGRAWTGGPGQEPDQWMVSAVDSLSLPGSVALFCAGLPYGKVSLSCRFDDVTVSVPVSEFSQGTWGSIKRTPI
jgi:hypothetical protein